MFKGLSGIAGDELFERAYDSRTRGHSLKLKKHHCSKDIRKFFFSERVVNRWNALDEDTVSVTTVNLFKSKLLRIRLLKRSFYTDTWCPTSSKASSYRIPPPGVAAPGKIPGKKSTTLLWAVSVDF